MRLVLVVLKSSCALPVLTLTATGAVTRWLKLLQSKSISVTGQGNLTRGAADWSRVYKLAVVQRFSFGKLVTAVCKKIQNTNNCNVMMIVLMCCCNVDKRKTSLPPAFQHVSIRDCVVYIDLFNCCSQAREKKWGDPHRCWRRRPAKWVEPGGGKALPLEKKVLIMKLKLMVVTVYMSRKTKTSVGSL